MLISKCCEEIVYSKKEKLHNGIVSKCGRCHQPCDGWTYRQYKALLGVRMEKLSKKLLSLEMVRKRGKSMDAA